MTAMFAQQIERHTISVLVDNEAGVLARVIGLFSGRGYNIESLTVAEVDPREKLSRITVVTTGTPMIIEQIKAQLGRLVPVHKVSDLTIEGQAVQRELALVKVAASDRTRADIMRLATDIYRARFVDASPDTLILEATGPSEKIESLLTMIRPYGIKEVARTGCVAMVRGATGGSLALVRDQVA